MALITIARRAAPAAIAALISLSVVTQAHGQESFIASAGNPALTDGGAGSWDGEVILPDVVAKDGTWYLFYSSTQMPFVPPSSIGFATSSDGVSWTKAACNPVLAGDGGGFDFDSVGDPAVVVDGDTFVMYYYATDESGTPSVGRATATDPCGPWTRAKSPVLETGSAGEWDSSFVTPSSVVPTDTGYVMYYSGSPNFLVESANIGRATSVDGITWTKYDDPVTDVAPHAESDPVMQNSQSGWDSVDSWLPDVKQSDAGWEMYYAGTSSGFLGSIGYATSSDGITWVKAASNPVFRAADDPAAPIPLVESPTFIDTDTARFLYYDYGRGAVGPAIGLAISDSDGDAVSDADDNCQLVANGPEGLAPQLDVDGDGFGNVCDADLDNDCFVTFDDLAIFAMEFGMFGVLASDFDISGFVSYADLSRFGALFGFPPGPSANPLIVCPTE